MSRSTTLSFTLRYVPLFAGVCAMLFVVNSWQMLAHDFHSNPIIFKGLGGIKLPLIAIEAAFIVGSSLVVGVGASFIYWLLKQR